MLDEVSELAGVGMALLALPLGYVILTYLRGGRGPARLLGAAVAPGTWLSLGAGVLGRTRQVALRGFRGTASGNQAFEDYRADMLRRLDDENREFRAFTQRLSRARDKAEFDEFMAERQSASPTPHLAV